MPDFKPLKLHQNEIQRFQTDDTVGILHGGTGATTEAGARQNLGLEIGVDVQEHSSQLDDLGGWTAVGSLTWTGSGWAARELATASNTRITVSNGTGASGNPTIDLASIGSATSLGLLKVAYDQFGRVTDSESVVAADLTALLDTAYLALAGGTMSGFITLHADPTNAMHVATKQYVDNLFSAGGIPPFAEVAAKTTANIDITSPGATHDGVTLEEDDRLLVASQTNPVENGIYVFNGAAVPLTRAADADEDSEITPARQVFVQAGGAQFGNTGWAIGNSSSPQIGTDPVSFTQVSGAASYNAGNGLSLTGNTFAAVGVSGQISVNGSGIGLATTAVTPGSYSYVTVDQYGRVTAGDTLDPADIGAQPIDSTLTALAAYNTNGFMVQTGADTFVGRTITGSSNVSVTNGNGGAGNPTLDLTDTGVTPGTYSSVTVDGKGRVTAGTHTPSNAIVEQMENGTAGAVQVGRAVYVNGDGTFGLALANNIATSKVIGLVSASSIAGGAVGPVTVNGIVEATAGAWDAVTSQSGGLTPGAEYFLSNITEGALTTSAPTTGVHAPIGVATSATKLKLDLKRVVIL